MDVNDGSRLWFSHARARSDLGNVNIVDAIAFYGRTHVVRRDVITTFYLS